MRKKRSIIFISSLIFLINLTSIAQTVKQVEAGENTLSAAIDAAADGEILELKDDGGLYTYNNDDKMLVSKTLTIRAKESLTTMPIVRNVTPGTVDARIFEIAAGGNLTLIGLNLDGSNDDSGVAYAKNIVRNSNVDQADSFAVGHIKIYDCLMRNTTEAFVKGHAYTRIDSIIIHNTLMYNCGKEALYLRESSAEGSPDVKYFELKNCTVANVAREAIYSSYNDPVFRIDHCTFNNIGTDGGDRVFYLQNALDAQITNSILSNQGGYKDAVRIYGTSSIAYCDTFNVGAIDLEENATIGEGMVGVDPQFADAANYDFSLPKESVLLTAGSDGGPIGDSRWVPVVSEPAWLVYDASVLPSETAGLSGNLLDISTRSDDSPGAGLIEEIIDDTKLPGNKVLKYLHPDGKLTHRYNFDSDYAGTAFTIMARIKAENDSTYDRAFDIRWDNANSGVRDEIRIWAKDSTIELEKADLRVKVDMDLYDWHTYRITMNGDNSAIYIDENPVAIVEGVTTATTSSKYIKMGDGSGDAIGGYLDWCTLDLSGAFAPGEGLPVPEGLYVDGTPIPLAPRWEVYDASVLPAETAGLTGDLLDLSTRSDDSPGAGLIEEIIDDASITGNKVFKYLNPDGKLTYRHNFPAEYDGKSYTIMARIKAENDSVYDRAFDVRWDNANSGVRDELRIWAKDSTIELEKADIRIKLDVDLYQWHTYRIVVNGDNTAVFFDENPEAVVQGTTTATTTNNYFKIGDGSGDAIGGYLDWCILDISGAYQPGQGLPVPEGLQVDTGPQPVVPKWLVYDGSILPTATGSGGDSLDLSTLSQDAPGEGFIETILDDPINEGNKFLQYLQPNGTRMYRYSFDDNYNDSTFTMMARIAAENDPVYARAFDIQWRNGKANSRDQLRIIPADSTLELDRSGASVKVDADLYLWHTYRIAVNGDVATVYMDQMSEPVLVGTSTETSGDTYIKIGDGSGDAIGGYLDWFIVDMGGAFGEGEGLPVPDGLIQDRYVKPIDPMWLVYDANILPVETAGFGHDSLDISSLSSDSPGPGFIEEIISDPNAEGNNVLKFLMPLGSRMYRYYYPENFAGSFTWIVRMKQEKDSTFNRALDLQWRNTVGAARDELRIDAWNSTLKLEKSSVEVPVDMDMFEWHTYRISVAGASTNVYIDENPEPAISGVAAESTSDSYIKFGDGGSAVNGAYLDWVAIDVSGAYSPSEGLPLPSNLIVDDYLVNVDEKIAAIPNEYKMAQNYPNPFNPSTTIKFQLPKAANVKVLVYNTLGQLVKELVNNELDAGYHSVVFDASQIASGVYFLTIHAGDFVDVKKMMLLK